MRNFQLLRDLITAVEEMENENREDSDVSLEKFTQFLNKKVLAKNDAPLPAGSPKARESQVMSLAKGLQLENSISRLFLFISRHARNYSKKAFEATPLLTLDDFSYLAVLYNTPSITKTDLIEANFQEKTSGTEVIRRLIKNGLAEQYDDQIDKRSKRVSITPRGKEVLQSIFAHMSLISELLVHTLSIQEREQLLTLLQKMESFHRSVGVEVKEFNAEELRKFFTG